RRREHASGHCRDLAAGLLRTGERELEVRKGYRITRPVAQRRGQYQQTLMRLVALQVRGIDREGVDVGERTDRASGHPPKLRQQRLGAWPVRGDRIAKMKQRLQKQREYEQRDQRGIESVA